MNKYKNIKTLIKNDYKTLNTYNPGVSKLFNFKNLPPVVLPPVTN